MAHVFDSGLPSAQLTLIRNGVVDVLKPLEKANGGYLATVIPWGALVRGYTDDLGIDLMWRALQGRAPAMIVGLGDLISKPAGMGGFNFAGDLEVVVYHYNNNMLSMTAGRQAIDTRGAALNTRDPGIDVMREHARELLIGQRVGAVLRTNAVGEKTRSTPSVKQMMLVREEELRTEAELTLWAQRFSVHVSLNIDPHRGVTQMLEELRTTLRSSAAATATIKPIDQARPGDAVLEIRHDPDIDPTP